MSEHKAIFLLNIIMLEIARKTYLISLNFANGMTIAYNPNLGISISCNPELRYYTVGLIMLDQLKSNFRKKISKY